MKTRYIELETGTLILTRKYFIEWHGYSSKSLRLSVVHASIISCRPLSQSLEPRRPCENASAGLTRHAKELLLLSGGIDIEIGPTHASAHEHKRRVFASVSTKNRTCTFCYSVLQFIF